MNTDNDSPVYVLTCTDARNLARVRASYRSQGFALRVTRSASFVGQFVANVWDPRGDWVGTFESFDLPALTSALAECIAAPVPFGYRPDPPAVVLPVIPPGVVCHWWPDNDSPAGFACGAERLPASWWMGDHHFWRLAVSPTEHGRACRACVRAYDERNVSA